MQASFQRGPAAWRLPVTIPRAKCLDCPGLSFDTEADYMAHAASNPRHRLVREGPA